MILLRERSNITVYISCHSGSQPVRGKMSDQSVPIAFEHLTQSGELKAARTKLGYNSKKPRSDLGIWVDCYIMLEKLHLSALGS